MDGDGKEDPQMMFHQLLSNLLQQVEALSNEEEVELRSKIQALGLEVPAAANSNSDSQKKNLDELEIARELDKLSAKLDNVDQMISSDPQVQSLLSSTANLWMPAITSTAHQRGNFTSTATPAADDDQHKQKKLDN